MPIIKGRPNRVPHLSAAGTQSRCARVCARFIGDAVDYVLNQLIETIQVKDGDPAAPRQDHGRGQLRATGMTAVAIDRVHEYRGVLALSVAPRRHGEAARLSLSRGPRGAGARPPGTAAPVRGPHLYVLRVWFSSAFFFASIGFSCLYMFIGRSRRASVTAPLPPYRAPEQRQDLFVVLGKQHQRTSSTGVEQPSWLTIPELGLYIGLLVVGAIGSGKTSACM